MIPAEQIEARRKRIRLPLDRLAELSGVEQNTVGKIMNGRSGGRVATLQKISEALTAEERRMLRDLAALHPDVATLAPQNPQAAQAAE